MSKKQKYWWPTLISFQRFELGMGKWTQGEIIQGDRYWKLKIVDNIFCWELAYVLKLVAKFPSPWWLIIWNLSILMFLFLWDPPLGQSCGVPQLSCRSYYSQSWVIFDFLFSMVSRSERTVFPNNKEKSKE